MKLELKRYEILIIPEDEAEEVYLEAVLGLEKEGDQAVANWHPTTCLPGVWAYLSIRKGQPEAVIVAHSVRPGFVIENSND